jgi:hypothetical protein
MGLVVDEVVYLLQLVVRGALPQHKVLKDRFIADPEELAAIAQRLEQDGPQPGEHADRFSSILHDLRIGGAWKRTNRGRLKQTEAVLCAHLAPALRADIAFLDLGASDGITTLEALHALRRSFGDNVKAVLADVNLSLWRYRRGPVVEYRAADGEPVMARIGRLGLRLARPRLAQHGKNPWQSLYLRAGWLRRSMRPEALIPLVHPFARREPGISVMQLDCLACEESLKNRFAAIRASNVLNRGYFDETQIQRAVGNLYEYLREEGCLIVSRNRDCQTGEVENGSAWVKDASGLRWVEDFGDGSEIKSIVDDWRAG